MSLKKRWNSIEKSGGKIVLIKNSFLPEKVNKRRALALHQQFDDLAQHLHHHQKQQLTTTFLTSLETMAKLSVAEPEP